MREKIRNGVWISALAVAWSQAMAAPLFRADFDNSLDGLANGRPVTARATGDIKYVEGLEGRAAVLSNNNKLHYPSKDNVRLEAGTILLWIKPLNWTWEATEFLEFFRLDAPADRSSLLLYKYMRPASEFGLVWLAGRQRKTGDTPEWITAKRKIPKTDSSQWTLLAATWDQSKQIINLYLNGERLAYARIPESQLLSSLAEDFFVLNTTKPPLNDSYETAIDSLTIEASALSEEEIRSVYENNRPMQADVKEIDPASIAPSQLTIPYLKSPPEIDGHYGANEWAEAATASGFSVFAQSRSPADRQSFVHIGYDDKNLYVAWLTPIPPGKPPVAAAELKDDLKIGRDDAVELILSPDGNTTYQWLINTKNTSADLRGEHFAKLDKAWNSEARIAGKIYEARWLCEMAIPLHELGGAPTEGQTWKINFCRDWAEAAESGRALPTSWSFAAKSFASDLGAATFRQQGLSAGLQIDPKALENRRLTGQWDIRNTSSDPKKSLRVESEILGAGGEILNSANQVIEMEPGRQTALPFDLAVDESVALGRFRATEASGTVIYSHSIPLKYPSGLVISPLVRAGTNSVEVNVQFGGVDSSLPDFEGRISLRDTSGKTLQTTPLELAKSKSSGRSSFNLDGIPDGPYELLVELTSGGQKLAEASKPFEKMLNPIWLQEKPGVSRQILPPWTAMTSQGNRVECWGRTYEFGNSLLPVQIRSAGSDLLARPAAITFQGAGKPGDIVVTILEKAADRIIVKAEQKSPDIAIQTLTTIEYDGMAKVELTVTPLTPNATLDQLALEFPLRKFPETLLHAHSFAWSDMIRKRLSKDFQAKFFPYMWLGSEERGLAWFAESDRHWSISRTDHCIQAPVEKGVIDWKITLVDHPTKFPAPTTFVFGFQATPVKPLPADRQTLRLHQPSMTHILPWAMRDKSLKKYQPVDKEWGWLAPHIGDYEGFRQEISAWRDKGISLPVYVAPTITSPESPSYQLFKESWRNPHGSYPFACAASTFTDELVWNIDQMIKKSGMESIYIDCAWAYSCGNHAHNCGYQSADGKTRLTYPIFAIRDELKRIYTLIHHPGSSSRALVWAHASGLAAAPIHSFVDVLTQGEEVRTDITANPDYMEVYSLDDWRITYGSGLGITMNFLPEFADPTIKEARYSAAKNATFVALALLHDTSLQDGFSDPAYLKKVYETLDKEGFRNGDIVFAPYWKQKLVTATDSPGLEISVYAQSSHLLAVIVNPTALPISAKLATETSSLWSVPGLQAESIFPDRGPLKLADRIEVPAKDFLVVKISPKP